MLGAASEVDRKGLADVDDRGCRFDGRTGRQGAGESYRYGG